MKFKSIFHNLKNEKMQLKNYFFELYFPYDACIESVFSLSV